jgi:hypothetical protein
MGRHRDRREINGEGDMCTRERKKVKERGR